VATETGPGDAAQRAQQILDALRGLSDAALEQAASSSPAPVAEMLRGLVDARSADDPAAAVARVMAAAPDAAALRRQLQGLTAQLGALPSMDGDALTGLFDEDARAALQQAGQRVRAAATDPDVAALLDRALLMLTPEGPLGQAARGAEDLAGTLQALRAAVQALAADPASLDLADLQRVRSELAIERSRVQGAVGQLGDVGALLADLEGLAAGAGRTAEAADLAMARGELLDRLDPEGAEAEEALWHALDLAEAAGRLDAARRMGHRLFVRALRSDDLVPVYTVSDRIAALAHAAGDVPAEIAALGKAALALAQLPASADDARDRLDRLQAAAEYADDPVVQARAVLVQGQVLEKLGDDAGARRAFRALMRRAADDPRFPYELGWAALHLGRLERRAGQLRRSRDNLALAAAIGARVPDWLLYGMASRERFELAQQVADDGLAREVLRSLDTVGLAIGGDEATALRDELGGRLSP